MDMDLPYSLRRHTSTIRSSNGCWTCRLRRKKCDERHPVCDACASLRVTCYYNQDKPEWMDGGVRQGEMAEQLKREIKEKSHRRHISGEGISAARAPIGHRTAPPAVYNATEQSPEASTTWLQRGPDLTLTGMDARESTAFR